VGCGHWLAGFTAGAGIFLYLFYLDLAKIYGPAQILQKYTSGVVGRGARCRQEWAMTWPTPSAVSLGVRGLTPWAAASGPSATAHSGSRPPSAVSHGARVLTHV
jgi:hypothetical protein